MEYEYKVVPVQNEVGFDFNKKCARMEEQMNQLGKDCLLYTSDAADE